MKYQPYQNFGFIDNARRRGAYRAKCRREQARMPLFAEQIATEQLPVDEEFERRRVAHEAAEARFRNDRAQEWLQARAKLRAHPEAEQIYHRWQTHRWITRHPAYLADLVHNWDRKKRTPATISMREIAQAR
jgi:hypothetical protein